MENQIEQPVAEVKPVQYAGFWWRFLAYIIDDIILSFVSFILMIPLWAFLGFSIFSVTQWNEFNTYDDELAWTLLGPIFGLAFFSSILAIVVNWLYYAILESSKHQATLGKMALGIKVTDLDGNRINFARATGRYFGKIISGMILMIGYIMAGLTEKKQALHDMLASCLVIKK